jgi:hypothetical protein
MIPALIDGVEGSATEQIATLSMQSQDAMLSSVSGDSIMADQFMYDVDGFAVEDDLW